MVGIKVGLSFQTKLLLKGTDNYCKKCTGKKSCSLITIRCNVIEVQCNKHKNIKINMHQNMRLPSSGRTPKHEIQYG